jgi:hypothetical protein
MQQRYFPLSSIPAPAFMALKHHKESYVLKEKYHRAHHLVMKAYEKKDFLHTTLKLFLETGLLRE